MKPMKSGRVILSWGLRLVLAAIVLFGTTPEVLDFALDSYTFYIALAEFILAVVLVVAGFGLKESVTVTAALLLMVGLIISFFETWPGRLTEDGLSRLLLIISSFYFVVNGNRHR
ncbi:MAG: hypothetical protein ACOC0C_03640 [Bacteroidota bacterium]